MTPMTTMLSSVPNQGFLRTYNAAHDKAERCSRCLWDPTVGNAMMEDIPGCIAKMSPIECNSERTEKAKISRPDVLRILNHCRCSATNRTRR